MKSTEIVQEGPLWQSIKSGIAGAKAGYTQSQGARAGQEEIDDLVKRAAPQWYAAQAQLQQRSPGQQVDPKTMLDSITKWTRQYFGVNNLPDYATATKQQQVTNLGAMQYLKMAAATRLTSQLDTQQQPQQATQPQQAGQPEQPQQAGQPAANPVHALFKDPRAFKAEWDKFIASKPNFKLITDDALLSTLKDMWMRTGGLKLESKKNKGKRV